jgi:hypothetical protein
MRLLSLIMRIKSIKPLYLGSVSANPDARHHIRPYHRNNNYLRYDCLLDRIAYAVESDRTSQIALERFCTHFNYEPMAFRAADEQGRAIYHTNVLMCIATDFAMIGSCMIAGLARRDDVLNRLGQSGRIIIDLSEDQIGKFAGNPIELQGSAGHLLALSETTLNAFTPDQNAKISDSATLVALKIPTIELSGGSVRCAIAGIHLTLRV